VASESGLGSGGDAAEQKPLIDFETVNNLGQTLTDKTFDGALTSIVPGAPTAPTERGGPARRDDLHARRLGGDSQTQTMDVDQDDGSVLPPTAPPTRMMPTRIR